MLYTLEKIEVTATAASLILLALSALIIQATLYYKHRQRVCLEKALQQEEELSKQLLQAQVEIQKLTLSSVAGELYNNIGQLLSTAKLLVGMSERYIAEPPASLSSAGEIIGKAITELRLLSNSLSRQEKEPLSLIENLESEVARIQSAGTVDINFNHPDKISLTAEKEILLFRVIREALENAVEHSLATSLRLTILQTSDGVQIKIFDDGKKFESHTIKNGTGLNRMQQSVRWLAGRIEWDSSPSGSVVTIEIPATL